MEELPQITIGLEDARPAAALNPFLSLENETSQEGRHQKDTQNLAHLKNSIGKDHERLQFQQIFSGWIASRVGTGLTRRYFPGHFFRKTPPVGRSHQPGRRLTVDFITKRLVDR
jgi:hypothetical protein